MEAGNGELGCTVEGAPSCFGEQARPCLSFWALLLLSLSWAFQSPRHTVHFLSEDSCGSSPLCLLYLQSSPNSPVIPSHHMLCFFKSLSTAVLKNYLLIISHLHPQRLLSAVSKGIKRVAQTRGGFVLLRCKGAWRSVDVALGQLILNVRTWVCGIFLFFPSWL